jgi:HD-like signal output (HDOD) protein
VTDALAALSRGAVRIPVYPAVVSRLQSVAADDHAGARKIAEVVSSDPVLAALVLARAGAAASGAKPTSIDAAVYRLGHSELIQLALAANLGVMTAGPGVLAALRQRAWRDALLSAGLCEALAYGRHLSRDQAYVAGLLHDFGAIVAIASLEWVATNGVVAPRADAAWSAIVDQLHVDVGHAVASAWKLAPELAEVIAEHHSPAASISANPLLRLVTAVDTAIAALAATKDTLPVDPIAALSRVSGLEPGEAHAITTALPQVAAMIAGFEVALPPAAAMVAAPTLVAAARTPPAKGWPITAAVSVRNTQYAADAIGFRGPIAMRPDWLADIVIDDGTDRASVLANVRQCEQVSAGSYEIVAAPYALAGDAAARWRRVVERVRGSRPR